MKRLIVCLSFLIIVVTACSPQKNSSSTPIASNSEQEIINLSKAKWLWMTDKKTDTLKDLFHEKSVFVHMGGSWGKERELE